MCLVFTEWADLYCGNISKLTDECYFMLYMITVVTEMFYASPIIQNFYFLLRLFRRVLERKLNFYEFPAKYDICEV